MKKELATSTNTPFKSIYKDTTTLHDVLFYYTLCNHSQYNLF